MYMMKHIQIKTRDSKSKLQGQVRMVGRYLGFLDGSFEKNEHSRPGSEAVL